MITVQNVMFEPVFTHVDTDGTQTTFAAERLNKWCESTNHQVVLVPIEEDFAKFCLLNRGVERHRLARLAQVKCDRPLLFCHMQDGSYLLVDGTHRYVNAFLCKEPEVKAWLVERDDWRQFIVHDLPKVDPEKLKRSFSGIS